MEIWKDIVGYEGLYQINNIGRVKSLERFKKCKGNGNMLVKERIIITRIGNAGYERVGLSINGKQKIFSVHRLLALAFILNPENKPQVNHKNGIKTDNNIENLEWATVSENGLHASRVLGIKINAMGAAHSKSKKIYQYLKDGSLVKVWGSCGEVVRGGFNRRSLGYCLSGENKEMNGFIWAEKKIDKDVICNIKSGYDLARKKVYRINASGITVGKYNSINETARDGYSISQVGKCCNGRGSSHKGFCWSFDQSTPLEIAA